MHFPTDSLFLLHCTVCAVLIWAINKFCYEHVKDVHVSMSFIVMCDTSDCSSFHDNVVAKVADGQGAPSDGASELPGQGILSLVLYCRVLLCNVQINYFSGIDVMILNLYPVAELKDWTCRFCWRTLLDY